jgi:hypothetical protein
MGIDCRQTAGKKSRIEGAERKINIALDALDTAFTVFTR